MYCFASAIFVFVETIKELSHESICPAREYGMYNPVALVSLLTPVIFCKSVERIMIFSIVIADGDDKVKISWLKK